MVVPGNVTRPSWSTDGTRLLYEDRVKHELHVVEIAPELQKVMLGVSLATTEFAQCKRQLAEAHRELTNIQWQGKPQWRVNSIGLTMLRIPAGQVQSDVSYGGPPTIDVPQDFFMGDREITVGQFQQFIDNSDYHTTEKPQDWTGVNTSISSTADHPAKQVSWYDAVLFCNWLSHRERLSPSYVRTGDKEKYKDYAGKETEYDAWRLDLNGGGNRLPTSAQWEYACRAGSTTAFSSGDDETLLTGYCQMFPSRLSAICGSKLPNGWGMFDVHGNVWDLCEDFENANRVFRGGSWYGVAAPAGRRPAARTFRRPARTTPASV